MRKRLLLLLPAIYAQGALAQSTSCTSGTVPSYAASDGGFGVLDGQIYSPDGQPFVARGINVADNSIGGNTASEILSTFPGINFIRLNVYSYNPPSYYAAFIDQMTAAGVVVELEDHTTSNGQNAGGASGTVFTGTQLSNELAWYTSVASYYANNPDVWFGTDNEPPANPSGAALSTWQEETYNAIRSAGNNSPIMMELVGGGNPGTMGTSSSNYASLTPSDYSSMTNIVWDLHYYGWVTNNSTNQTTVDSNLASTIAQVQTITSADGTVPVIIGEYGPGTNDGSSNLDTTVTTAVTTSGYGSAAWTWNQYGDGNELLNANGSLTAYGQQVAAYIAGSGATGCPQSPVPTAPSSPAITAAENAETAANTQSIAEVASIAAQQAPSNAAGTLASTTQLAAAPASGAAPGGTLASVSAIAAGAAAALPAAVPAQIRTMDAPGGTMPTPAPVSTSTSFTASGNGQTIVPAPGNDTGVVSGSDDTINATGGIQTILITGPGNTVTTGPYNDTITVESAGNTINTGAGNDTIVLAYNGQSPSSTINADAAAVSPLATVGNVFMAPAAGTGTLTIRGVLASNDRIDVTQALVGLAGYDGSNAWNYLTAASSPNGCTLSVNGQVIVTLLNGSPNGNIGPFIQAEVP